MRTIDILKKGKITEKSLTKTKDKVYVFEVDRKASKYNIKHSIESYFKVEVQSVRTLTRKGKTKRVGRLRKPKSLPDSKIAYVTVKKGVIDIFPNP